MSKGQQALLCTSIFFSFCCVFFKTLDLSGNNLTSVPANLPENLENINLAGNIIDTITKLAFLHTPHLKGKHSDIKSLQSLALENLN